MTTLHPRAPELQLQQPRAQRFSSPVACAPGCSSRNVVRPPPRTTRAGPPGLAQQRPASARYRAARDDELDGVAARPHAPRRAPRLRARPVRWSGHAAARSPRAPGSNRRGSRCAGSSRPVGERAEVRLEAERHGAAAADRSSTTAAVPPSASAPSRSPETKKPRAGGRKAHRRRRRRRRASRSARPRTRTRTGRPGASGLPSFTRRADQRARRDDAGASACSNVAEDTPAPAASTAPSSQPT